ncbi:MAG: DUF4279 domain-containing protein [Gammaproteobacteria bacterium]|nr:DUF4279 domain-containing protein [Gammaproteobacteria bacterium]
MDLKLLLSIHGTEILPKDIAKILGIQPDVELRQGERNKALNLSRVNLWSSRSNSDSEELIDHWRQIGPKITPVSDKIAEIIKTGSVKMTIGISGNQVRLPSIKIPAETSYFSGFVNTEIDIDHLPFNEEDDI